MPIGVAAMLVALGMLDCLACGQLIGLDGLQRVACVDCAADATIGDAGGRPSTLAAEAGADAPADLPARAPAGDGSTEPSLTIDASPLDTVVTPSGDASLPAPPASYLIPSIGDGGTITTARVVDWALVANRPATLVYTNTVRGVNPTTGSAPSPFTMEGLLVNGSTLVWHSEADGQVEADHERSFAVDANLQATYGFILEQVRLSGTAPVISVAGGSTVHASFAAQVWADANCPSCVLQIVYAIDGLPIDCVINQVAAAYPGVQGVLNFDIAVPPSAGNHRLDAILTVENDCPSALKASNARSQPTTFGVLQTLAP